ncbi:MMS19 nucleotide excision repair protein-like protein [Delitschia confertaspora ATCC 74209]|uniref:MMS19 nucleotide excision repair protein n=1 Tax=Delitschia confertaspora ATCC 74209 TaxID=1513339 RepID=A0A9P4MRY1_9PLEO|nr:MMS19 nucleotide excision repair protein-like protein [Delitschia confertaspora ATCC 74209]
MSDIQLYLLEIEKNKKEASAIARQSATKLQNNQLKLVGLIQGLGEYINSEDGAIRAKTMLYLAEVLAAIPQKVFSLQQRNLLCDFILSRITDDTEGLGACTKGLLALEKLGKWDDERVGNIMETLLHNTHPLRQYKFQSERYPVLQLIDHLMAKYRDALRNLHDTTPDFMGRFISYFDGEKDPRNLMVVFSILRVPMTEWNIRGDAQELFDAVFNYFPITFRPPPDDPYGITAQDLKDRLRNCISSTPDFAPYAFPALLDKLDSTSINTKRDVLQTVTSCVTEYGSRTVSLYSVTLWDSLKYEILNTTEEDLAQEALSGLAAIASSLSQGATGPLNAYLRPVTKECNEHLEDAPTKQSEASGRILRKVAAVSAEVDNIIISSVLPNIFTLYQTADTMAKRRGLLEVLIQLLQANIEVYGEWRSVVSSGDQSAKNALAQLGDQALEILTNGLSSAAVKEVSFRLVCVNGLIQLSRVRQLLSDSDIGKVIQLLHDIVIHEESYGKDEIKEAAINGLVEIAHQKPQVVVDYAFPAFMAQLPDIDVAQSTAYIPVLEAFAKLGGEEKIFDRVILRLKNKLNSAVQQGATSKYIVALLSAMIYALNQGASRLKQESESSSYYNDIVLPLLSQASSSEVTYRQAFNDETTLDLVGRICNIIVRPQPLEVQNKVSAGLYTLFRRVSQTEVPPFSTKASAEDQKTMVVSTHLLAAFRKEAMLPCEVQVLLPSLVNFSQTPSLSNIVRAASLRQISLVVNKYIPTPSLKHLLQPVLQSPIDLLNSELLDPSRIRIIFALLKGLVLRNSTLLNTVYPCLLSFLSNPTYGKTVAYGFTTLLQPDDLLTKANHCQISGLHKQKSFALLVPDITSSIRESSTEIRPNYLIALSGILRWTPFEIAVQEVGQMVPLLLQSLDLKDEDIVKEAAIGTLTSILRECPKEIETHAGSLVSRLLNNAIVTHTHPSSTPCSSQSHSISATPAKLRAEALKCLALVPEMLRQETVLPYRRQVVKRLTGALDDRKRRVRSEAVRCRSGWLGLDEEDDE